MDGINMAENKDKPKDEPKEVHSPKKAPQEVRDTNKEDVITNAMDFWRQIYENKKVQIKFVKKNGEVRYMLATLDFNLIPSDQRPKKLDLVAILKLVKDKGIIRVYDLEKKDWRSVPFLEVEWLKTSNLKTFRVIKNKKNYAGEI